MRAVLTFLAFMSVWTAMSVVTATAFVVMNRVADRFEGDKKEWRR